MSWLKTCSGRAKPPSGVLSSVPTQCSAVMFPNSCSGCMHKGKASSEVRHIYYCHDLEDVGHLHARILRLTS